LDFLDFITSVSVREVSSTVVLFGVVVLILTGKLVPNRQLKYAQAEAEAWKGALGTSEAARQALAIENYKLLETSRISDQFYRDFLPAVDENTQPRAKRGDENGGVA
jgi:hypothetical protein